jgi:hypothetical protein
LNCNKSSQFKSVCPPEDVLPNSRLYLVHIVMNGSGRLFPQLYEKPRMCMVIDRTTIVQMAPLLAVIDTSEVRARSGLFAAG